MEGIAGVEGGGSAMLKNKKENSVRATLEAFEVKWQTHQKKNMLNMHDP